MKVLLVCLLVVLSVIRAEESGDEAPSVLVRVTHNGDFDKLYDAVPSMSIDFPRGEQVDIHVLRDELHLLEQNGYSYDILEEDRSGYFQYLEDQKERSRRSSSESTTQDWESYHNYEQLEACLRNYTEFYSNATELISIGKSSQGRDLWALKITENIEEENPHKPELHYIANIHGDETVGRELMLRFIGHYLDTYHEEKANEKRGKRTECAHPIVRLMEETVLYVMPSMNPDGFELGRRQNAKRYDLNRNFPDQYRGSQYALQPETDAMMKWVDEHNFILSVCYHGGDVVVSYPFDGTKSGMRTYSKSPEDDIIKMMALEYASYNPEMLSNREFTNGVTNGAQWYPLYGGMADWKYFEQADIELTIELSFTKWPAAYRLPGYWEENKHSFVNLLSTVFTGVWGRITYLKNGEEKGCSDGEVWTDSISKPVLTNDEGYYFRILTPGTHKLVLSCGSGRNTDKIEVEITEGMCLPEELNHQFD